MQKTHKAQAGKKPIEHAPETEEAGGKSPNHEVAMKKAMDEVKKVSNNINNLERKSGAADEGPKHLSDAKPITKKKELERFKGPKPTKSAKVVKTNDEQLAEIGSFEESTEPNKSAEEHKKKKEHKKAMKKIDKEAAVKPAADAEKKPAEDKAAKEKKPAADKPADAPANEEACKKKADEVADEEDPLVAKKENVEALGKKNLNKAINKMKNVDPKDYSYAKRNQNSKAF